MWWADYKPFLNFILLTLLSTGLIFFIACQYCDMFFWFVVLSRKAFLFSVQIFASSAAMQKAFWMIGNERVEWTSESRLANQSNPGRICERFYSCRIHLSHFFLSQAKPAKEFGNSTWLFTNPLAASPLTFRLCCQNKSTHTWNPASYAGRTSWCFPVLIQPSLTCKDVPGKKRKK